jgi:electron transfer flavoprotein alpha subunit
LPKKLFAAGADVVYVVEDEKYEDYNNELYTNAFCELVNEYKPSAVLVVLPLMDVILGRVLLQDLKLVFVLIVQVLISEKIKL